jgi:hypothetical protein
MNERKTGVRINRIRGLAAVVIFGLAALAMPDSKADERLFAPAGHQFSIPFPPNPKAETSGPESKRLFSWSTTNDDIFYLASHEINSVSYAEGELAADLANFLKETGGTVIAQHRQTWPAQHESATALRFSFRARSGLAGEGVFIIAGKHSYGAIVLDTRTLPRQKRLAGIIDSLKILQLPAWRWANTR